MSIVVTEESVPDQYVKVDSDASMDEIWVVFEPELSTESSEEEGKRRSLQEKRRLHQMCLITHQ